MNPIEQRQVDILKVIICTAVLLAFIGAMIYCYFHAISVPQPEAINPVGNLSIIKGPLP